MTNDDQVQLEKLTQELLSQITSLTLSDVDRVIKAFPKPDGGHYKKSQVIEFVRSSHLSNREQEQLVGRLKLKPVRSISGVTPITVLTKPFPCPGKCIFCPNDVRMPKSYIASEPGAQRAKINHFDPYLQTYNRLLALHQIGHNVDKAEIIVLGGTWSIYPEAYQIWFISRCFEALNDFGEDKDQRQQIQPSLDVSKVSSYKRLNNQSYNQSVSTLYLEQEKNKQQRESASWDKLFQEHQRNENSQVRCVGLVLETRPDAISEHEVIKLRRFGCTKTQIGIQSLTDSVLQLNKRGHDVAASRRAMRLLRQAGLKIHVHWMPNLYGSSVNLDIEDYQTLFTDPDFKPDEIKIYPCSLIDDTELMEVHKKGLWQPYNTKELMVVLTTAMHKTPEYCRITRVVRDIPSQEIVVGNKITNFRQLVEQALKEQGLRISDIRAREIKQLAVIMADLEFKVSGYKTSVSTEYFLEYATIKDNRIAGFLRLSLPTIPSYIEELCHSAIIREVHVYGEAVRIGHSKQGKAQHLGLGKKLIAKAEIIARENNYSTISVISAIGTRQYYQGLGYNLKHLYQQKDLTFLS